jgi:hypothetical protein
MKEILMCDKITRIWCCRIGLVFSVFSVLSMMLFQIWNYYFSLVQQMDEMSIEYPRLNTILSLCNNTKIDSWNIDNCRSDTESWTCAMSTPLENRYISESSVSLIINQSHLIVTPVDVCDLIKIWILPW